MFKSLNKYFIKPWKQLTGWTYAILAPVGNAATIFFGSNSLDTNTYYSKLGWGRRLIDAPLTFFEFWATVFSRSVAIHKEYEKQANRSWTEWWNNIKHNSNPKNWTFGSLGRTIVWLCSWSVLVNVLISTFDSFCMLNWFAVHEMVNFAISFITALSVSVSFDIFIGRKARKHLDNWAETTQITRKKHKYLAIFLALYFIITTSLGQGLFTLLATTRGLFLLNRLFFPKIPFFSRFLNFSNDTVLAGGVISAALTVFATFLSRGLSIWQHMMQPASEARQDYTEIPDKNKERVNCCHNFILASLYWSTNIGNGFANGLKTTAGGEDFLDYRGWFPEFENLIIAFSLLGLGMIISSLTLSGPDIKNNMNSFFSNVHQFFNKEPQLTLSINDADAEESSVTISSRGSLAVDMV